MRIKRFASLFLSLLLIFSLAGAVLPAAYADGDTLQVKGTARSYAGVPVQDGKVKYKVERRRATWWWNYSRYWNQGYATEAVKAVLTWAFQNPKVTAIEAETDAENTASKRVLEKCGFVSNGKIGEEGPRFTVTR